MEKEQITVFRSADFKYPKVRGFEVVSIYRGCNINIPQRKTKHSAGYDIECSDTVAIQPGELCVVKTGLKAYMSDDEYLGIHIRSGISIKKCLSLINSQGIIDSDYYNNVDNEGHIGVPIFNHGTEAFTIKKGDRIAQGIFYKYLLTDFDTATGERVGGIGSTGLN